MPLSACSDFASSAAAHHLRPWCGERSARHDFHLFWWIYGNGWRVAAQCHCRRTSMNWQKDGHQLLRWWPRESRLSGDTSGKNNGDSEKIPKKGLMLDAIKSGREQNLESAYKGLKKPLMNQLKYKFYEKRFMLYWKRRLVLRTVTFPYCWSCYSDEICEFVHSVGINMLRWLWSDRIDCYCFLFPLTRVMKLVPFGGAVSCLM